MSFWTQLQRAADRIKSAGFIIQKIEGQQRNSKTEHVTPQLKHSTQAKMTRKWSSGGTGWRNSTMDQAGLSGDSFTIPVKHMRAITKGRKREKGRKCKA